MPSSLIQSELEASYETPVATAKSGLARPKAVKISNLEEASNSQKEATLSGKLEVGKPKLTTGLSIQRPALVSNTQSDSSIQIDSSNQSSSNIQRPSFLLKRGSNPASLASEVLEDLKEGSTSADSFQKQSLEPPTQVHRVIAQSEEFLELQRKLLEKEKANLDLEEKLNVLKQKRVADQNKIKEIDKIKMQNQQVC